VKDGSKVRTFDLAFANMNTQHSVRVIYLKKSLHSFLQGVQKEWKDLHMTDANHVTLVCTFRILWWWGCL